MKKFLLAAFAMAAVSAYAFNYAPTTDEAVVSFESIKKATPEMMKKMAESQALRLPRKSVRPVTVAADIEGTYEWSWQQASARAIDPTTVTPSRTGVTPVLITEADNDAGTVKIVGMFDAPITGTLDFETYPVPAIELSSDDVVARASVNYSGSSVACQCTVLGLMYIEDTDNPEATGWYFTKPIIFVFDDGLYLASNVWLTRYIVAATNEALLEYTLNPVWMPGSSMDETQLNEQPATMTYLYQDFNYTHFMTYTETVNRGTNTVTFNNFANVAVNPITFTLYEDKTWDAAPQVLYSNTNGTYTLYAYPSPGAANLAGTGDETTLVSSTNWTGYDLDTRYWIGNRNPFTIKGQFTWPGTTAVENINAKTVSAVKYVNIAGQVSSTAFDGMNIVITDYTDGTSNVTKIVK